MTMCDKFYYKVGEYNKDQFSFPKLLGKLRKIKS